MDTSLFEQLAGKIANISSIFPVWDDKAIAEEKWAEPLVTDKKTTYPRTLGITQEVSLLKLLNLEPIEVAVDPKAKKDAKKDPKKGAVEAPVELTEVLVDEHGRKLPVLFREKPVEDSPEQVSDKDRNGFLAFDILHPFARANTEAQMARIAQQAAIQEAAPASTGSSPRPSPNAEEPAGDEIDSLLCGAFRLVQRFTSTISRAHLNALAVVTEDVQGAEQSKLLLFLH